MAERRQVLRATCSDGNTEIVLTGREHDDTAGLLRTLAMADELIDVGDGDELTITMRLEDVDA